MVVPDLGCGGGRLQSNGLVWFLHFADEAAESTFLLCPHSCFSLTVVTEGKPWKRPVQA